MENASTNRAQDGRAIDDKFHVAPDEAEIIWHVRPAAVEGRRDDQSQAVAADSLVEDDPEPGSGSDATLDSDVDPVEAAEEACRKRASALGCDT
jgi:hypothetical protein